MLVKKNIVMKACFRLCAWEPLPDQPQDLEYIIDELARKGKVQPMLPKGILFIDVRSKQNEKLLNVVFMPQEISVEHIEAYLQAHHVQFERRELFLEEIPTVFYPFWFLLRKISFCIKKFG